MKMQRMISLKIQRKARNRIIEKTEGFDVWGNGVESDIKLN